MRAKAGSAWHDLDLIASTAVGTPVDRHSLARSIRLYCEKVGIEPPIAPYELRAPARLSWVGGEVIRERTPLCS